MDLKLIKSLVKEKDITIKELSQKIGMSERGLHKSIRNNSISAEYLEKIANYLDVSIGIFFGEKDTKKLIKCLANALQNDFPGILNEKP